MAFCIVCFKVLMREAEEDVIVDPLRQGANSIRPENVGSGVSEEAMGPTC